MADQTDMKTHEATYLSVLGMLKYGAVACFLIAFIVIFLISSGHK
jgi:hypothetical protein